MKRKPKIVLPAKYILLILTVVCVAAMITSFTLNISGGPLNAVAGYVFVPMQRGINTVGAWITEKADNLKNLSDVIGKSSGNWFSYFTIDKGTDDGIEVDMNVIAGSGLVGIVTDVGPNYAKVTSIINDTAQISGMVTTTSDNLIVNGSLQNMNENMVIEFSNLNDSDNKVAVGDPVVTSYISDKYQQGILIGYISSLSTDSNNLTKSGTITPAVDFEHIEEVLVILDKKQSAGE